MRKGITIAETLVALAVGLAVLGLLSVLHRTARAAFGKADVHLEAVQAARTAVALIAEDLAHLAPVPAALDQAPAPCPLRVNDKGALELAPAALVLDGSDARFALPVLDTTGGKPRVRWVVYSLRTVAAGEPPALVRTVGAEATVHRSVRLKTASLRVELVSADPRQSRPAPGARAIAVARVSVVGASANTERAPERTTFALTTLVGLDATSARLAPDALARAWRPVKDAIAD